MNFQPAFEEHREHLSSQAHTVVTLTSKFDVPVCVQAQPAIPPAGIHIAWGRAKAGSAPSPPKREPERRLLSYALFEGELAAAVAASTAAIAAVVAVQAVVTAAAEDQDDDENPGAVVAKTVAHCVCLLSFRLTSL